MKKQVFLFALVTLFFSSLFLTSCKGDDNKNDGQDTTKTEVVVDGPQPGEIPYDFPVVKTTAKNGEYVLTPSKSLVDRAWEEENSTFIFNSSEMVAVGDKESEVSQVDSKVMIPNSLVIPIPANQTVQKGDVVLTWWQSGSGMQRAYVVDDADPTKPVVHYLDLDYSEDRANEQIKENSFVKLTKEFEPGTAVAYQGEYNVEHWNVIRVEGNKILAIGLTGKMAVLEKSKCTALPVYFEAKVGDMVQVPYIGSFRDGKVLKVDENIGRVWVEVEFGGSPTEAIIAVGDITTGLTL